MNHEARQVLSVLDNGPTTTRKLSLILGVSQSRLRALLRKLAAQGLVTRHGNTKGAMWARRGQTDAQQTRVARLLVRELAERLQRFTYEDLQSKLPGVPERQLRAALRYYERGGRLEVDKRRRNESRRYRFVPTAPVRPRERRQPPEAAFVDRSGGGRPVEGTGRQSRPGSHEVQQLFEEITAAGGELQRRARHWCVMYGGQIIATIPGTPSDHRALLNARANLRRAGLPIGEEVQP